GVQHEIEGRWSVGKVDPHCLQLACAYSVGSPRNDLAARIGRERATDALPTGPLTGFDRPDVTDSDDRNTVALSNDPVRLLPLDVRVRLVIVPRGNSPGRRRQHELRT